MCVVLKVLPDILSQVLAELIVRSHFVNKKVKFTKSALNWLLVLSLEVEVGGVGDGVAPDSSPVVVFFSTRRRRKARGKH